MRVQKLKNAPSVDVAQKVMRTEIVKHILDGGVLDAEGTLFAHENVLAEARRTRAFRSLLGLEVKIVNYGAVTLNDWETVRGRRAKKKTQPPQQHLNLGVPNVKMITCRKIQTSSGPLFRDGGFLMMWNDELHLFFLHQIYKDKDNFCLAVVEFLEDVSRSRGFHDPFLDEMGIRTWKKSGRFMLLDQFQKVSCGLEI